LSDVRETFCTVATQLYFVETNRFFIDRNSLLNQYRIKII